MPEDSMAAEESSADGQVGAVGHHLLHIVGVIGFIAPQAVGLVVDIAVGAVDELELLA